MQVCVGEKNIEVRPSGCPAPSVLQVALARMQLEADEQSGAGNVGHDTDSSQDERTQSTPPQALQKPAPDLNEVLTAVQSGKGAGGEGGGDGGFNHAPTSTGTSPSMSPSIGGLSAAGASNTVSSAAADATTSEPTSATGGGAGLGNAGYGSLGSLESAQQPPLQTLSVDFVLYVASGDDMTDEDVFGEMVRVN
jgi:hypothetical protein